MSNSTESASKRDSAIFKGAVDQLDNFVNNTVNVLATLDQQHVPASLFHYTDATGLDGILRSPRNFRATHIRYLDDPLELRFAMGVAAYVLDGFIAQKRRPEFLMAVKNLLHSVEAIEDLYITCFSCHGDLLSQWRAFANGGNGYRIEIAPNAPNIFPTNFGSDNLWKIGFVKVVYTLDEQVKWLRGLIEKFFEILEGGLDFTWTNDERSAYMAKAEICLANSLAEILPRFKREFFEEEKEWRILLRQLKRRIDQSKDRHVRRFRSKSSALVPFVEIGIGNDECWKSVSIGPSMDVVKSTQAVKLLLAERQLMNVQVQISRGCVV
jgi:hypothetical protein